MCLCLCCLRFRGHNDSGRAGEISLRISFLSELETWRERERVRKEYVGFITSKFHRSLHILGNEHHSNLVYKFLG